MAIYGGIRIYFTPRPIEAVVAVVAFPVVLAPVVAVEVAEKLETSAGIHFNWEFYKIVYISKFHFNLFSLETVEDLLWALLGYARFSIERAPSIQSLFNCCLLAKEASRASSVPSCPLLG